MFALFIKNLDKFGEGRGVNIGDDSGNVKKIWYLAFADDLAILTEDKEALKEAISQMEVFCDES